MNRKLMSIHGLLDEMLNDQLRRICLEAADGLELSDRFFRIPLHVSLKRSFYVEDEVKVRNDIEGYLKDKKIYCGSMELFKVKDRLWLKISECPELYAVHEQLDEMLKEKYGIVIDEFDRRYLPHISLFSNCSDRLDIIYERLMPKITDRSFIIDSYYVGTDRKG